jgi:phosphoglycolate phosphatase
MTTLVLFDVDGTLLAGSGTTHVAAFADALHTICGAPDPFRVDGEALWVGDIPVNGLVDAQIADLCLAGAVDAETAGSLRDRYRFELVNAYRARVEAGESCGHVLPGVPELLDELARRDIACGLLTGNTEEICALKMAAAGLDDCFVTGGFGGVIPDRSRLFAGAVERARAAGVAVDALCYVGDTPLDIEAADRAAVPIVAVATGRYVVEYLCRAHVVVRNLGETSPVADALERTAKTWQPPS